MQITTALAIFKALEQVLDTTMEDDPPLYNVRLDAFSGPNDHTDTQRYFRIRVTAGKGYANFAYTGDHNGIDALQRVLDLAREHNVDFVELANNGLELF